MWVRASVDIYKLNRAQSTQPRYVREKRGRKQQRKEKKKTEGIKSIRIRRVEPDSGIVYEQEREPTRYICAHGGTQSPIKATVSQRRTAVGRMGATLYRDAEKGEPP